jgi:putative hydrolase of the HAD superfamily
MRSGRRSASSRPPKAVIFDIGRVIVRLEPERALASLAPGAGGGRSAQQLWSAVLQDPRWDDWQEGRLSPRQWHEHLTRQLDLTLEFEDFCAAWNRTLHPETILQESLFASLAARCKLAVLSNTDPLHSAALEAGFSFLRHFPARIYSWRVGASKPSAAIYQTALDALGVAAGEALYVDDIAEYVEAARAIGRDAIRFESPSHLAAEFTRRGLPGK